MNALKKPDRCVVLATDDAYALPAAVALSTAYANCDHDRTEAIVIDCGISAALLERIRHAWPGVQFRALDSAHVSPFTTDFPPAGMARLALDRYIDLAEGRVLYLDSDVLVRSSIEPLFDSDLNGFLLGAVPAVGRPIMGLDPYEPTLSWHETEYAAGGATPGGVVFNSGVLLIDIAAWRSAEILGRSQDLGSRFPVADQRILNGLLARDWYPLPQTWNSKDPEAAIYHFAGARRPWQRSYYRNPIWLEYLSAAEDLGWRIERPRMLGMQVGLRSAVAKARHRVHR